MAPALAVPQQTPRRSASRLLIAMAAGAALASKLLSGVANSNSAFVGGTGLAVGRSYEGRQVQVFREITPGTSKRRRKEILELMRPMSDEDLHNTIALSRQCNFEHRLDVFRRKSPDRKPLNEMHYKLIIAKKFLREREKAAAAAVAEEAGPEEPETYRDFIARTYDYEAVEKSFSMRPGLSRHKLKNNQRPFPRRSDQKLQQRYTPYYNMPNFTPPGENATGYPPWETRNRYGLVIKPKFSNRKRKQQSFFTNKDAFRVPKPNPAVMPPKKK